jgi:DNA-binding GntR family transcriptional regulator
VSRVEAELALDAQADLHAHVAAVVGRPQRAMVAALEARDARAVARETAAHLRAVGKRLFEQLDAARRLS